MLELLIAPSFPGETVVIEATDQAEAYRCADDGFGKNYSIQGTFRGGDDRQGDGDLSCMLNGGVRVDMGDGNDAGAFGAGINATLELAGGRGNDTLTAYSGDFCRIAGGDGNDAIEAVCNRGELLGGPGTDTLARGSRSTLRYSFVFTPANTPKGAGRDTVRFFRDGSDRLTIQGDADRTRPGNQAYSFRGRGTNPGKGQIMWFPSGRDKIVTGFDGRTRFEIKLEAFRGTLDALDFAR
jgi:hypothetical protein